MVPERIVIELIQEQSGDVSLRERFTHMPVEDIQSQMRVRQAKMEHAYENKVPNELADIRIPGIVGYREATEEDLATFVPMISPFEPSNIRYKDITEELNNPLRLEILIVATDAGEPNQQKILSYGTSSFGYDVTLSDEFRIFTNINSSIIDPLAFDEKCLVEFKGDICTSEGSRMNTSRSRAM
jgi:hypothetical protein